MKAARNLLLAGAVLTAGGVVLAFRSRPHVVLTRRPVAMQVTETIAASGRLRGGTESSIGAPNGGRVAEMWVREGSRVKAHQVLARMDSDVLAAQVAQARDAIQTARGQLAEANAAVQTASAQLLQASRPPLASDVERLRADNAQNIEVAQAKRASAKQHEAALYQHFTEMKNGARTEEVVQAQTQVEQAEVNVAQLERDKNRQQTLYKVNAVARVEWERAETNYLIGKQTLDNARSRLQQLQAGNRAEQVAQAQADYLAARDETKAAEASLSGARRSGDAQMRSLLASPRLEDVDVAQRRLEQEQRARDVARQRVEEAQTALTLARRRAAETRIVAPFAGTVTQIVTEVGAIAGPNAPIVRLVRTGKPEIHVDLDESNLGKLRRGQQALVTNDAFPKARFQAKVTEIGAQVDTERGTVEVRLTPLSPPAWVRPGQTFTVNIVLDGKHSQLIVPVSAVSLSGGAASLLVVENGKIVKKNVKAASLASEDVPILQGISPDAQVVVQPAGLLEGDAVVARNAHDNI